MVSSHGAGSGAGTPIEAGGPRPLTGAEDAVIRLARWEIRRRARDQLWRLLFFAAAACYFGLAFTVGPPGRARAATGLHSVVIVGGTVLVLAAVMLAGVVRSCSGEPPSAARCPGGGTGPRRRGRGTGHGGRRLLEHPLRTHRCAPRRRGRAVAGTDATRTGTPTRRARPPPPGESAAGPRRGRRSAPRSAAPASAAAGGEPDHGTGTALPEQPLDPATRNALGQQLVTARNVAMTYPTVASALAAGYIKVTTFVPLIGAHYLNFAITDDVFDPAQPEMLLYDGTDRGRRSSALVLRRSGRSAARGLRRPERPLAPAHRAVRQERGRGRRREDLSRGGKKRAATRWACTTCGWSTPGSFPDGQPAGGLLPGTPRPGLTGPAPPGGACPSATETFSLAIF